MERNELATGNCQVVMTLASGIRRFSRRLPLSEARRLARTWRAEEGTRPQIAIVDRGSGAVLESSDGDPRAEEPADGDDN